MGNEFGEIFEVELKCWCHGLSRVQERVDRSVLHEVIKEFAPVLREAIEHHYVCDIVDTARRLVTAAKCPGWEKEIAFYILSHLPVPGELDSVQVSALKQTVAQVEQVYRGAVKRLEKKWKASEAESWTQKAGAASSLGGLSFPPKTLTAGR